MYSLKSAKSSLAIPVGNDVKNYVFYAIWFNLELV